jgi:hypothetical protein
MKLNHLEQLEYNYIKRSIKDILTFENKEKLLIDFCNRNDFTYELENEYIFIYSTRLNHLQFSINLTDNEFLIFNSEELEIY